LHSATRNPRRKSVRLGLLRLAAGLLAPRPTAPRKPAQRVLLIRPDHVGDVLLTAPAIALLRASLPEAHLTYVVGPWSLAAARNGPPVDELRTLAFPGFTRRAKVNLVAPYVTLMVEAARLRGEGYDLAVVLRGDHWWGALLALAAGIPSRVGGDTPETRQLLTHAASLRIDSAWGEQALDVARLAIQVAGAESLQPGQVQQFRVSKAAISMADAFWQQHRLQSRCVVGIHPAAGAPLKSWPIDRWSRLADRLVESGLGVLLVGAPEDADLLNAITGHMHRCAPIACGQSLEVSAAMYARCALVVTVDSGAGHLAAAVGTPTVRLYGPASPSIFGPWPSGSRQQTLMTTALACAPCGYLESPPCGARSAPACMLALDVGDVLNAVSVQLERG
jgi:ADP-heptose:LPS heptosyltransferase